MQKDRTLLDYESVNSFPYGACTLTVLKDDSNLQAWDGSLATREEHPYCTLVKLLPNVFVSLKQL